MVFSPKPSSTRWEGFAVSLWIVLIDLLLVVWAIRRPVDPLKFVLLLAMVASIPVLVYLLYRTWSAFTLEYWVDRNAITIHWANVHQIIPMRSVRQIHERLDLPVEGWPLLLWPLPYLRLSSQQGPGAVNLCATVPVDACIVLETDDGYYALSPADPKGFIAAVQERYRMGPATIMEPARIRQPWLGQMLAGDTVGHWLLTIGAVGVLVLFAVLMISFPDLPEVLTVRYNSAGLPEEIGEKAALFRLPIIGLLAWGINGIWGLWLSARGQRTGAHMLWGGAVVVQGFSLLALISLIT